MKREEITAEEANHVIDDARRLAWGSNKFAKTNEQKAAIADQAGAVAAAEVASKFTVKFPPKKSHADGVDASRDDQTIER